MHTKDAAPKDAELVYSIKEAAYAEHVIRERGAWDETFQRDYTRQNLPHTRLVCVESEVVGWIAVREDEVKFELIDVHILPAFQNRGFGSALLRDLLQRADSAGKPTELGVLKHNPSRSLYERLGFAPFGETKTHLLMSRPPSNQRPPPP